MMKRTLLATAVAALTIPAATAAPFMPMDARGLAMGNTGVASAKRAHAPAYNPSLLSQARENDDFSLILPQVGVWLSDEEMVIDEADNINDKIFPRFEELLTDGGANSLESLVNNLSNIQAPTISLNLNPSNIPDAQTQLQSAVDQLKTSQQDIGSNISAIQSNIAEIKLVNSDLTKSLNAVDGNPISARLGLTGAVAFPGKKFAVAVSATGSANISARVNPSQGDLGLLGDYIDAASGYTGHAGGINTQLGDDLEVLEDLINDLDTSANPATDLATAESIINSYKPGGSNDISNGLSGFNSPQTINGTPIIQGSALSNEAQDPALTSTAEVVGIAVTDVGLSFSREFNFGGQDVAIGITPKIQKIYTFHYGNELDNFDDTDSDVIEEYRKDYTDFNIDIGASYKFGSNNNWVVGAVIKNLLGGEYDYLETVINEGTIDEQTLKGGTVKLNPQIRAGIAYQTKLVNLAFDLDLVKNDPIAYEAATQYASFGAEFDMWGWAQLRAGYRTNLKESDMSAISAGIGISPFDVLAMNFAVLANPNDFEKEAGAVFELGLNF